MSAGFRLRVQVSFGALLLLGWFTLINGWRLMGTILLAALLHELGHVIVLQMAGAKIRGIRVGLLGAVLDVSAEGISYGWELAAALAGPAVNFFLVIVGALWRGSSVWIGLNLVLCVFNLLPIALLDGGRALRLLVSWRWGPELGERFAGRISGVMALLAALFLFWLMYRTGGSLWLLPPACWMLGMAMREIWENA